MVLYIEKEGGAADKRITLLDKQRNEEIRTELNVYCILEKVQQVQLARWYRHLLRMTINF